MVNLHSQYIEHKVDSLIESFCFFGKVFGAAPAGAHQLTLIRWPSSAP
jgi:hypothetical protein